jgi:hypothetical protein
MAWGNKVLVVVVMAAAAACTGDTGPTREKSAVYFGMTEGRELTYQVENTAGGNPTSARILIAKDSSFADYLGFKTEERNAGNIITETLVWASEAEDLRLVRLGDCLPNCTDFSNPVVMVKNPVVANQSYETETATRVTAVGSTSEGPRERHTVTVGAQSNVVTPAGTFQGYPVLWRRFVGGSATSEDRTYYFTPDKGFIRLDRATFQYKLQSGVAP